MNKICNLVPEKEKLFQVKTKTRQKQRLFQLLSPAAAHPTSFACDLQNAEQQRVIPGSRAVLGLGASACFILHKTLTVWLLPMLMTPPYHSPPPSDARESRPAPPEQSERVAIVDPGPSPCVRTASEGQLWLPKIPRLHPARQGGTPRTLSPHPGTPHPCPIPHTRRISTGCPGHRMPFAK